MKAQTTIFRKAEPKTTDFTRTLKTVSGGFRLDIPCAANGTCHIAGNGENQFAIQTTSGNVSIHAQ